MYVNSTQVRYACVTGIPWPRPSGTTNMGGARKTPWVSSHTLAALRWRPAKTTGWPHLSRGFHGARECVDHSLGPQLFQSAPKENRLQQGTFHQHPNQTKTSIQFSPPARLPTWSSRAPISLLAQIPERTLCGLSSSSI